MHNTKNLVLRITALILFVIIPIVIVVKMPILKQFYCSKADNKCIYRVYNTFDKKPSIHYDIKISDIRKIQRGYCGIHGQFKKPCISIETPDNSYTLNYNFSENDAIDMASDMTKYLKDAKQNVYKIVADKSLDEINKNLTFWSVIILFGLLIAGGIIKDNKKKFK